MWKNSALSTALFIIAGLQMLMFLVSGQVPSTSVPPTTAAPEWDYSTESAWAAGYPNCDKRTNTAQAPLDFTSVPVDFGLHPFQRDVGDIDNYTIAITPQRSLTAVLHELSVAIPHPVTKRNYKLLRLELFSPSMHALAGARVDAELQLVYELDEETTEPSTRRTDCKYLIQAVLLRSLPTALDNTFLIALFGRTAKPIAEGMSSRILHTAELFPASRDYIHYTASMAMPPCTPSVEYYVFTDPVTMSMAQAMRIRTALGLAPPTSAADLTPSTGVTAATFRVQGNVRSLQGQSHTLEGATSTDVSAAAHPMYNPRRFLDFVGDDVLLKNQQISPFNKEMHTYASAALGMAIAGIVLSFVAVQVGLA